MTYVSFMSLSFTLSYQSKIISSNPGAIIPQTNRYIYMLISKTSVTIISVKKQNISRSRLKRKLIASFKRGAGSVMAVGGTSVVPVCRMSYMHDWEAIANDWRRVGDQLNSAIKHIH